MTATQKFSAKRIKENSFALFADGDEFGRLQNARGKWLLSTANAELKRLFDATVLTADATLQAVLWTIRAILDHLAEIARNRQLANEGELSAADLIAKCLAPQPKVGMFNQVPA